jgi:F-type H+-transporting ATPase subunit delta
MTQRATNFAKAIFELAIPEKSVQNTKDILTANMELLEALSNPAIKKSEKYHVIDTIFEQEMKGFLKVLCDHSCMSIINQIFEVYDELVLESKNIIKATITYVKRPDDNQLEKMKEMVCKKYNKAGVLLQLNEDPSLIGGFVLSVKGTVFDKSIQGTLNNLYKTLVWR